MEIEKIFNDLEVWKNEAPERRAIIAIVAEYSDDNKVLVSTRINAEEEKSKRAMVISIIDTMCKFSEFQEYVHLADSLSKKYKLL